MRMLPLLLAFAIPCFADYRPDRDGALTTVALKVVDPSGEAIHGAKVMFRVFTTFDKCYKLMRDTDEAGYCEITGKTRGEVTVVVTKDGYYASHGALQYRDLNWENAVAERKWTRGVVVNRIVLKPIVNPRTLVCKGMTLKRPPIMNQLMPFDVFAFDWCAPYGKGTVKDFEIGCYNMTNSTSRPRCGVLLRAENCVDGFDVRTVDEWCAFRYANMADEGAEYVKEIRFGWTLDKNGNPVRNDEKPKNRYLVFRIRSETNQVGKIVRSHYGIIDEGLHLQQGLTLGVLVNPNNNDTSLEHDWAYKHMKKAP